MVDSPIMADKHGISSGETAPVLPPQSSREIESDPVVKLPSALHALAWSTAVAVFLGLATALGVARTNGIHDALGLSALTFPVIDQSLTTFGILFALQVILMCVVISVTGRGLYLSFRWGTQKLSRREIPAVPPQIRQRLWWFAIALLITDAVLMNAGIVGLAKSAENLLFKSTSEIGSIWTHVIFEDDHATASSYNLLFSLGVTIFVWLSWWLAKYRFKWLLPRTVFITYAIVQVAGMMLGFAHLHGTASTVEDYPVVAFSSMTPDDKHTMAILLGQDDKLFAFLILHLNDKHDAVQSRYVLYLPRTELKWMTVIGFMPLYRISKINDLERLAEQAQKSSQ